MFKWQVSHLVMRFIKSDWASTGFKNKAIDLFIFLSIVLQTTERYSMCFAFVSRNCWLTQHSPKISASGRLQLAAWNSGSIYGIKSFLPPRFKSQSWPAHNSGARHGPGDRPAWVVNIATKIILRIFGMFTLVFHPREITRHSLIFFTCAWTNILIHIVRRFPPYESAGCTTLAVPSPSPLYNRPTQRLCLRNQDLISCELIPHQWSLFHHG